ncbi:hypothetical protein [Achromobacter piechaudii]|uniref:DUF3592 domain-containing protein n=1 Tax=Achromobacter piechaudii TaxID=72556 RepID=A0ABN7F6H7_9BURK|nr:hypothetical protein [Achromobacter piechaudii]CAB3736015.1 hypothetical protein LMG1873_05283 [Achromobacter piechaudii]
MIASVLAYLSSLEFLVNSLVTVFAFLGGCLLIAVRRRIRTVEFTTHFGRVTHEGAGHHLASLKVMLQGEEVANLWWGTVKVFNDSGEDLTALNIHVVSGPGLLLNEHTAVEGTANILWHAPEYAERIRVPEGEKPTQNQMSLYYSGRHYLLPVFNRGQAAVMSYLISVPPGAFPSINVSVEHKGVRTKYRRDIPRTLGVSTKVSAWVGLLSGLLLVCASAVLQADIWVIGLLGFFYGCFASHIGALLTRMARVFWSVVAR